MGAPLGRIVAAGLLVASVTACTSSPPTSAGWQVQVADGSWSAFKRAFGEPAHAGMPGVIDWRKQVLTPSGQTVGAQNALVTAVTVDPETMAAKWAPAGKGKVRVGVAYRDAAGLRVPFLTDPVTVRWELWSGDGSPDSPNLGELITSGEARLETPHGTFDVDYPLPEQTTPAVYGILTGSVQMPNGKAIPFRRSVVRRSRWAP